MTMKRKKKKKKNLHTIYAVKLIHLPMGNNDELSKTNKNIIVSFNTNRRFYSPFYEKIVIILI